MVVIPPPPSSLGNRGRRKKVMSRKPETPNSAERRKQFASEGNNSRKEANSTTGRSEHGASWVSFTEESIPSYEIIADNALRGSFENDEILKQIQVGSTRNSFLTAMDFSFAESGNDSYVFSSAPPQNESRNEENNLVSSEDVRFNSCFQEGREHGCSNISQNFTNDNGRNWEDLAISLDNDGNEDTIEPLPPILAPPHVSQSNLPPRHFSNSSYNSDIGSDNANMTFRGRDKNTSSTRSRSESRTGRSNSTLLSQQTRRSRSTTRRATQGLGTRSKSKVSSTRNRSRPSRSESRTRTTERRTRTTKSSSIQPKSRSRGRSVSHKRSDVSPTRSTMSNNSFHSTSSNQQKRSTHREGESNEISSNRHRSSSLGPGMFNRRKRSSSRSSTRSASGSNCISNSSTSTPARRGLSATAASALVDTSTSDIMMSNNDSQNRGRFRSRSRTSDRSRSISKGAALKEKLFGDHVSASARRSYLPTDNTGNANSNPKISTTPRTVTSSSTAAPSCATVSLPEAVHTRILLKSSVFHNEASNLWISTVNTNQKQASNSTKRTNPKYLKAFSFHTEREARESVYANAPAKMLPFSEHPNCFICKGKFAIFRRASHCRNCGVCICSSCSVTWHKAMIPETYNSKKESQVKVCKSCNFLSRSFRHALLQGNYDNAITLYKSGNINLRCPFMNVKGYETMFPIHCAAQGGNLLLVRWLVDAHYCPIKMIRTGNKHKGTNELLGTSKGRNVLDIAMAGQHTDILRYLVKEKDVSVYEIKDLKTSLNALEAILNSIPERQQEITDEYENYYDGESSEEEEEKQEVVGLPRSKLKNKPPIGNSLVPTYGINPYIDSDDESVTEFENTEESDDVSVATTVADACIICYENTIDCVITPCGHQICCLECTKNLSLCPVCNVKCEFIRIYKP